MKTSAESSTALGAIMSEGAEAGGYAFSAAKFQPDGKDVADDREESGQCGRGG